MSGPGVTACLRATLAPSLLPSAPSQPQRALSWALGPSRGYVEEYVATPCPLLRWSGNRHRIRSRMTYCRAGGRVGRQAGKWTSTNRGFTFSQGLVAQRDCPLPHRRESKEGFHGGQGSKDGPCHRERGALRGASAYEYRNKSILPDTARAELHAPVHLRARGEGADDEISAAFTSEARKLAHYTRPAHVSVDGRSHELLIAAFAGGKVWPSGKGGRRAHRPDRSERRQGGGAEGESIARGKASKQHFY